MAGLGRLQSNFTAICLLAIACVLARVARGRIDEVQLDKDDRRVIVLSTPFGFMDTGTVDMFVTKLLVWKPSDAADVDLERLGFFLAPSESEVQIEYDVAEGNCPLYDNPSFTRLFTLKEVRDTQSADQAKQGGEVQYARQFKLKETLPDWGGGELSLYYVKCADPDYAVSTALDISMYNLKGEDERVDYLSVGEDALPLMYMCLFVLFAVVAALWTIMLIRGKDATHRIHWLMLVLVGFKALTLLSQAGMYHMISRTGRPDGWNISYYFWTALRSTLFFTLIVLIGTGWSYMKPFIAQREKRILMIVLPLQVVANVAIVILDETTPAKRSWFAWRDILHLVDIICCCAVLFPIVWSIKHLRDASETDGKAARCLHKLQLFKHFYVTVVCFIYFTRIVIYLLRSTLPYGYVWVADAVNELATLAFYVVAGALFRPKRDNPYLALRDDDDLELEMGDVRGGLGKDG